MIFVVGGALLVFFCFAFVVFIGAPYLPTKKTQIEVALRLLSLKEGQRVLDLGSGDGIFLVEAAKKKVYVTGFEINPVLFIVSWLRILPYRKYASVKFGNYWLMEWPETDAVFVFLHDNFMKKLDKKMNIYSRGKRIKLASFAFKIPGKKINYSESGVYLYSYGS